MLSKFRILKLLGTTNFQLLNCQKLQKPLMLTTSINKQVIIDVVLRSLQYQYTSLESKISFLRLRCCRPVVY